MKSKEVIPEHKEDLDRIGKKLEALRKKKGTTVIQLADDLDMSRNWYRQMEKGKIYFSAYNFLRLLKYHDITLEEFFSEL